MSQPPIVPFLDLRVTDPQERQDLLAAVDKALQHGRLIMGPEVEELEKTIAASCSKKYAVGVNSGTDALFLALKSLDIKTGDQVITTPLSWVATANAIALTGATPVFADIADDLNIAPDSVEKLITPQTRALLPVHFTGKICQMTPLQNLARRHNITLIEDAAQAFGARHFDQPAGSFGRIACFSMNPMKVFAAAGEAGMILTDEKDIYERLTALRYNGTVNKEQCHWPSLNGRLDTIQAAILLRRLPQVPRIIARRRRIAQFYSQQLAQIVETPREKPGEFDCYYTYTIQTDRRDELMNYLAEQGIETKIQHPILMPQQPAYRHQAIGNFPHAQRLVQCILSLPVHEKLSDQQVEYVINHIKNFII